MFAVITVITVWIIIAIGINPYIVIGMRIDIAIIIRIYLDIIIVIPVYYLAGFSIHINLIIATTFADFDFIITATIAALIIYIHHAPLHDRIGDECHSGKRQCERGHHRYY